jgi:hypothetical protein
VVNKTWHFTRLSAVQIKQLCTMAGQARAVAKTRFDERAEKDAEAWRKWGQDEATGVQNLSLRKATQVHYLPMRGFWFNIIGNCEQAFYDFLNAGEQNEAMRQIKWRLAGEMSRLADGLKFEKSRLPIPIVIDDVQAAKEAWNYTRVVCTDKFHGRRMEALVTPEEVEQLCHTVFNRASAKLGVGKAENRNKSQRAGKRAKKAPLSGFEEALEMPSSDRTNELLEAEAERTHGHVQDARCPLQL